MAVGSLKKKGDRDVHWRKRWPDKACCYVAIQTSLGSLIEYETDLTPEQFNTMLEALQLAPTPQPEKLETAYVQASSQNEEAKEIIGHLVDLLSSAMDSCSYAFNVACKDWLDKGRAWISADANTPEPPI